MKYKRGIATATIVAMVIIIALVLFGMLKLMQTYTSAYNSLVNFVEASERPILDIQSINPTSNGINIVVENKGGEPITVLYAYVYEYNSQNVPSNVVYCTNVQNTYVAVGQTFTCSINSSEITHFIGVNRPLRIEVVTNKGPEVLGLPPLLSNLLINIQQPQWMVAVNPGEVYYQVNVWCPLSTALKGLPPTASFSVPYVANATSQTSRSIFIPNLTMAGLCKVQLVYRGPYRTLESQYSNSLSPVYAEETTQTVVLTQEVALEPGQTSTVSFKMPEVYTGTGTVPPPVPNSVQPTIYDFSWYYYPALFSSNGYVYGGNNSVGIGRVVGIANITNTLLHDGIISVSSPVGCAINDPSLFNGNASIIYGIKTFWAHFALDNGIPIIAGPCQVLPNSTLLTVSIPIQLSGSQSYLVIPIFSTFINDSTGYTGVANVSLYNSNGVLVGDDTYSHVFKEREQFAVPFNVTSSSSASTSTYFVRISLYYNGSSFPVFGVITISKIVILPILPNLTSACSYFVNNIPLLPYGTVYLNNGSIVRNAPIILNYAISTNYFNSASEDSRYTFVYVYPPNYYYNSYFYATSGNVNIGGNSILGQNATPYYIKNTQYTVEIKATVNPKVITLGGLYAYYGPYQPYYPYARLYYPQLLSFSSYEDAVSQSQSWIFLYNDIGGPNTSLASNMVITVNAPHSGDYIVISLFGYASNGIVVNSNIQVSGGNLIYNQTQVSGGSVDFYSPVIVQMTSPTTTITISPPLNSEGQGVIGIINLAVYQPPSFTINGNVSYILQNVPIGITLYHVVSTTGSVTVQLIRADTSAVIATWSIVNPVQNGNYLLNIDQFLYYSGWMYGDLPYLDQQVPYILQIYGAECKS